MKPAPFTRGTCECKKRRYATKGYAKQALKNAKRRGSLDGKPRPLTYYPCKKCDGFHLSSYPPNRQRMLPIPEELT